MKTTTIITKKQSTQFQIQIIIKFYYKEVSGKSLVEKNGMKSVPITSSNYGLGKWHNVNQQCWTSNKEA